MITVPISSVVALYEMSSKTLQDISHNEFNNAKDSFMCYRFIFKDITQLGPHLEKDMKTIEGEKIYYDMVKNCVYVSDLASHTIGKLCGIENALKE